LTFTAGGQVVKRFSKKWKPNPKTFVGTGKLKRFTFCQRKRNINLGI
jgi:50S ribosomal subunit-associated GTPase HflX